MKLGIKDYSREELVKSIAKFIYKESEIFNTIHITDQAIRLNLIDLAESIESGKWLEGMEDHFENEQLFN